MMEGEDGLLAGKLQHSNHTYAGLGVPKNPIEINDLQSFFG